MTGTVVWTDEQVQELKRMWTTNILTKEMAAQLGVTKSAVIGKVHRLGLPPRRRSPGKVDGGGRFSLSELGNKQCRWPVGEPGTEGFHFCGDPAIVPGKPYCAAHCKIAYAGLREKKQAAET